MNDSRSRSWQQVNIAFPDWDRAEQVALARLVPVLCAAEGDGSLDAWFFIRKRPRWRVRYFSSSDSKIHADVDRRLDELVAERRIDGWTKLVYEPEVHAFGGPQGMATAHRLFHRDSRGLVDYLRRGDGAEGRHRREMSVMLCSILMRAAAQDWYEQGDVWARVAAHREPSAPTGEAPATLPAALRRLMTVDAESQMRHNAQLAHAAAWADAYAAAGRELADLAAAGALRRGLRDVITHHVIFAWNRLGLPYAAQSLLAATAQKVVFGPDPTRQAEEDVAWTAQRST